MIIDSSSMHYTEATSLASAVARKLRRGFRFSGLFVVPENERLLLRAVITCGAEVEIISSSLPRDATGERAPSYPAISRLVPSAEWYERALYDRFGVMPEGHPRLISLLRRNDEPTTFSSIGEGVFTIPYGPVRSGVFESVEYLIESTGEDILHLGVGLASKTRSIEERFVGVDVSTGILLAERVEGIASVAHALGFAQAIESICSIRIPRAAELLITVHAELERVVNHLDVIVRLCEAAGLAVAHARFSLYKEQLMRLRIDMCGNRFGRGVVVPGGIASLPNRNSRELIDCLDEIEDALKQDTDLLMRSPSFIDRLRGSGVLTVEEAETFGLLGPVGRGSSLSQDVRVDRPYAAYAEVGPSSPVLGRAGDALSRTEVRLDEIWSSFSIIRRAIRGLAEVNTSGLDSWQRSLQLLDGEALGWAEAPQGELLVLVALEGGRIAYTRVRSASWHNLQALPRAFKGDVLTDFAFIEASFGLSPAGAAL